MEGRRRDLSKIGAFDLNPFFKWRLAAMPRFASRQYLFDFQQGPFRDSESIFRAFFLSNFDGFWGNFGAGKLTITRKAPTKSALFSKMVGTVGFEPMTPTTPR